MRALLVAIVLASVASAQRSTTVLEALGAGMDADPGFTASQRSQLASALRERFADYGIQTATGRRAEAVQVAMTMLVEGSFDESPAERSADVAFAAYQAVARGAPAEVVEGIGLYGYRKKVPADRLSAWANGYHQMTQAGVPGDVAADLVRAAMEHDWEDSTFDILKWSIVQAAKERFDARAYSTYLLGHMLKGGQKPGALTGQAQAYFKKLAKTGEKPVLPEYSEGSFAPKTLAEAKTPEPAQPVQPVAKPAVKPPPPAAPLEGGFARIWPGLEKSARSYLGTPYVWGGVTHRGIDCSALTQNSYGENSVKLPRVSQQQWKTGAQVGDGGWRQGDLVFFNTLGKGVSHVGMVIDTKGPQFIHASSSKGVIIVDLSKNYYKTRYLGARRVVP